MYLARFSDGADDFVQGLVRLRYLAPLHGDNWNECAERLAGVVGGLVELESARVALRVNLPTRGAPEALYSVLAPASKEPALRHVLAAFTRLDRISPGSIALPPTRETFDEWAFSFPPLQANVNSCGMRAGSIWFACQLQGAVSVDSCPQRSGGARLFVRLSGSGTAILRAQGSDEGGTHQR